MAAILPQERRKLILDWLQDQRSLTIDQLAQRFGVSAMTIHRDLDVLAKEGLARKVHGGVVPAGDAADIPMALQMACAMCGKRVPRRTAWVATPEYGERRHACCAHCGLLMLHHSSGKQSVLATDFLYGQMVNAYQATFVLGSDVTLCCVPGVLCFATRSDAERYQQGFGGETANFDEAMAAMSAAHHTHEHDGDTDSPANGH